MKAYVPVQLILNCNKEVSIATVHLLFSSFGVEFELSTMLSPQSPPYLVFEPAAHGCNAKKVQPS